MLKHALLIMACLTPSFVAAHPAHQPQCDFKAPDVARIARLEALVLPEHRPMIEPLAAVVDCIFPTLATLDSNHGIIDPDRIEVVDGDTIRIGATTYRLDGYDTPETWQPQCDFEEALGNAATARLETLLDRAFRVELVVLPGRDRYDRSLARLFIDGQDIGDILIHERLARRYDGGRRQSWCD